MSATLALSPPEVQSEHPELAQELFEIIEQHHLALADDNELLQTVGGTTFESLGGSETSMWCSNNSRTNRERMKARGCDVSNGVTTAIIVGVVVCQKDWWSNKAGPAKQSEPHQQERKQKPGSSRPVLQIKPKAENPVMKAEGMLALRIACKFRRNQA